jgi:hypothetical protein
MTVSASRSNLMARRKKACYGGRAGEVRRGQGREEGEAGRRGGGDGVLAVRVGELERKEKDGMMVKVMVMVMVMFRKEWMR